ncbi:MULTISPECIES: hypothetical protein [Kitasatospora]|uniref:hypothetical protein n=1 Tax=Kitasatospora TaxID=2063 RepID=UPI0036B41265
MPDDLDPADDAPGEEEEEVIEGELVDERTGEILDEDDFEAEIDEADLAGWVFDAMEPAVRRERMNELRIWVTWLVRTQRKHAEITPCWYRHEDVRDRLAALFVAWVRVYSPGDKRDTAEADWFLIMDRIVAGLQLKECTAARHHEPEERQFAEREDEYLLYTKTSDAMTRPASHPAVHEMLRQGVEA